MTDNSKEREKMNTLPFEYRFISFFHNRKRFGVLFEDCVLKKQ